MPVQSLREDSGGGVRGMLERAEENKEKSGQSNHREPWGPTKHFDSCPGKTLEHLSQRSGLIKTVVQEELSHANVVGELTGATPRLGGHTETRGPLAEVEGNNSSS